MSKDAKVIDDETLDQVQGGIRNPAFDAPIPPKPALPEEKVGPDDYGDGCNAEQCMVDDWPSSSYIPSSVDGLAKIVGKK